MECAWAKGDLILVDGREVARARRSLWSERADVQIGPEFWIFRADGSWLGRRPLIAECNGVGWFRATPSGLFSTTWSVTAGQDHFQMSRRGLFSSTLDVRRPEGVVGYARRSGLVSTRPVLHLSQQIDPRAACFLLWVAFIDFRRSQRQAQAAT